MVGQACNPSTWDIKVDEAFKAYPGYKKPSFKKPKQK